LRKSGAERLRCALSHRRRMGRGGRWVGEHEREEGSAGQAYCNRRAHVRSLRHPVLQELATIQQQCRQWQWSIGSSSSSSRSSSGNAPGCTCRGAASNTTKTKTTDDGELCYTPTAQLTAAHGRTATATFSRGSAAVICLMYSCCILHTPNRAWCYEGAGKRTAGFVGPSAGWGGPVAVTSM
jgi:hypothetical protein